MEITSAAIKLGSSVMIWSARLRSNTPVEGPTRLPSSRKRRIRTLQTDSSIVFTPKIPVNLPGINTTGREWSKAGEGGRGPGGGRGGGGTHPGSACSPECPLRFERLQICIWEPRCCRPGCHNTSRQGGRGAFQRVQIFRRLLRNLLKLVPTARHCHGNQRAWLSEGQQNPLFVFTLTFLQPKLGLIQFTAGIAAPCSSSSITPDPGPWRTRTRVTAALRVKQHSSPSPLQPIRREGG